MFNEIALVFFVTIDEKKKKGNGKIFTVSFENEFESKFKPF